MVKVISLSNEAYKKLSSIKNGKSFSEVVVNLVDNRKRKNIMEFAGALAHRKDELEKMKKMIEEDRKKFKLRGVKL